jgi:hypothetical protein
LCIVRYRSLTHYGFYSTVGGFGATDESVAQLLHQALQRDIHDKQSGGTQTSESGHSLQDLVNEGLAFALRASDYHTSRQLLILYSVISSKHHKKEKQQQMLEADSSVRSESPKSSRGKNWREVEKDINSNDKSAKPIVELTNVTEQHLKAPPPPPLDTDRLRSATNSDGLLAVLGAAQVLKAMQDGSAKRRVKEAIESIEE